MSTDPLQTGLTSATLMVIFYLVDTSARLPSVTISVLQAGKDRDRNRTVIRLGDQASLFLCAALLKSTAAEVKKRSIVPAFFQGILADS